MEPEVLAAVVAGGFSLLAVAASALVGLNVRSLRKEFQVNLSPERLKAYRKLWALLEPTAPSRVSLLEVAEYLPLDNALRDWYYEDGNGIFLSASSQREFLAARRLLREPDGPASSEDVRKAFSALRSSMKDDIGVYGKADRSAELG